MPLIVPAPLSGHISIRFVTDYNSPLAFLIRADTMAPVSHVEAVLRDGTVIGAYGGGVARRANDADADSTNQMFVYIPRTSEQIDAWEAFLVSKIGTPYDYEAIAGFALHKDMHTLGHVICSALITDALRHNGVVSEHLLKPDHMTSPSDLAMSLSFMAKMCDFVIVPLEHRS